MKNVMKIFTAMLLALTTMPVIADTQRNHETIDALEVPAVTGITVASLPTLDTSKIKIRETPTAESCTATVGGTGIKRNGKCYVTKCKDAQNYIINEDHTHCILKTSQRIKESYEAKKEEREQSALDREYNKDIDKIVDAYNTVTKKIYSKCVADGISIEECKTK